MFRLLKPQNISTFQIAALRCYWKRTVGHVTRTNPSNDRRPRSATHRHIHWICTLYMSV